MYEYIACNHMKKTKTKQLTSATSSTIFTCFYAFFCIFSLYAVKNRIYKWKIKE